MRQPPRRDDIGGGAVLPPRERTISPYLAHWKQNQPFRWIETAVQVKRSIHSAELIYGA
jgi:hypothetical protein